MLQKFIETIKLKDIRVKNRLEKILIQFMKNQNNIIFATTNKEYQANSRLVNSKIQFDQLVNEYLGENITIALKESTDSCIYLPFDGSDIRKVNTKKSEGLCKVRDLDGKLVGGYHILQLQ
jgi:hypothetical protein